SAKCFDNRRTWSREFHQRCKSVSQVGLQEGVPMQPRKITADMIEAASAGNQQALGELYELLYPRLQSEACRLLLQSDCPVASEHKVGVADAVWDAIYDHLPELWSPPNLYSWQRRIE